MNTTNFKRKVKEAYEEIINFVDIISPDINWNGSHDDIKEIFKDKFGFELE